MSFFIRYKFLLYSVGEKYAIEGAVHFTFKYGFPVLSIVDVKNRSPDLKNKVDFKIILKKFPV